MATRRLEQAAAWMGATIVAGPGVDDAGAYRFTGGAIDSRALRGGELFFALPGTRVDGHRFVAQALAAGAAAAVVHETDLEPGPGQVLLRVPDTYAALHALTRGLRRELPGKLLGLTGSAGKTTTKELLVRMLARRYRVAGSPGNLNNLYGFPLALLSIPDDTQWMVAEMGMSTPGELGAISRLAAPDVALVTNVRPVHLENLGSLEAIAHEKLSILDGLAEGGLFVANADDPQVVRLAPRHRGRTVWFGHGTGVSGIGTEVRASAVETLPEGRGMAFTLEAGGERQRVELALLGRHNVDNCLAAAACAVSLGVSLAEIAAAMAEAVPAPGRGEVHRLPGGATVIDDSYNSNPEALELALEAAAALPGRRRWAVLGAMLELGPEAPAFHQRCGRAAAERGFSPVFGVGELARPLVAGVVEAGGRAEWLADAELAAARAQAELTAGDVVLIKGSRGIGLDRVVSRLLASAEGGAR